MMKYLSLFFIIFHYSAYADMFLKLNGETIMGHEYKNTDGSLTKIPDTKLVNENGQYRYKYVNGGLVELSSAEIEAHPLTVSNKVQENRRKSDAIKKREANERLQSMDCDTLVNPFLKDVCYSLK